MNVEGKLTISLQREAEGHRVAIGSSRPLHAVRLFVGKTPEQVLSTLPLLYSVCGTAQGCAAYRAFTAAGAVPNDPALDTAHALLVWTETAREHLWRVVLDWPGLLGESVDSGAAKPLVHLLPRMRGALFADAAPYALRPPLAGDLAGAGQVVDTLDDLLHRQVFGVPATQWPGEDAVRWAADGGTPAARLLARLFQRGWERLGSSPVQALPALEAAALEPRLAAADAAAFVAAPVWDGQPRETSALTRQADQPAVAALQATFGNGLLTRFVARLVELSRIPALLREGLTRLAEGGDGGTLATASVPSGVGQVEAARGRLVHRVALAEGQVDAYAILAPTEWNFHPDGAVARGLAALPPTDEATLREQAALLVQAVDPCVSYELVVKRTDS